MGDGTANQSAQSLANLLESGPFRQNDDAQAGREESSQFRKGTHRWRYCHLSGNVWLNECCLGLSRKLILQAKFLPFKNPSHGVVSI
jgi:hypothetical protein